MKVRTPKTDIKLKEEPETAAWLVADFSKNNAELQQMWTKEMRAEKLLEDQPPKEIKADPMLAKAFLNMIDNSLRYGGKVRNISLSMVNNVDSMVLCYTDDGYGIHDRDKEHIFEKGFW